MIRRRLIVTGKIQDVSYRDWFVEQAKALGLDGWVRNRADQSVEAVVQGAPEMLGTMIARGLARQPSGRHYGQRRCDDRHPRRLRHAPDRLRGCPTRA